MDLVTTQIRHAGECFSREKTQIIPDDSNESLTKISSFDLAVEKHAIFVHF